MREEPSAPPPRWQRWLGLLVLGVVVTAANLAVYFLLPPTLLEGLGGFGYLGALLATALANATVIVPVPYYPLLIRLGETLNPWGITLAAAVGSVIGELVAYFVGRSGQGVVAETPFYRWVHRQLSHPWRAPLVIFALAAPPNPFFDVAGLLAGALGVPIWIFALSTFLGRIVRMATVVFVWLGLQG